MNKEEFNAMSLPYNLKVMNIVDKSIHEVRGIDSCLCFIFKDNFWQTNGHTYTKNIPILRPLSELREKIIHNGNEIIPLQALWQDFYKEPEYKSFEFYECPDRYLCHSKSTGYEISYHFDLKINEFWKIQRLVEWHFDIAGLIEKGEAVDYTMLESFSF